jgi:hypothetical protein
VDLLAAGHDGSFMTRWAGQGQGAGSLTSSRVRDQVADAKCEIPSCASALKSHAMRPRTSLALVAPISPRVGLMGA